MESDIDPNQLHFAFLGLLLGHRLLRLWIVLILYGEENVPRRSYENH